MFKTYKLMARQRIRLTESQLNRVIKESVKRALNEDKLITFNWTLRVSPKNAEKAYNLQSKLENASWIEDFERSEGWEETQSLSMKPNMMKESLDYENIEDVDTKELMDEFHHMTAYRNPRWNFGDEFDMVLNELKRRGAIPRSYEY